MGQQVFILNLGQSKVPHITDWYN